MCLFFIFIMNFSTLFIIMKNSKPSLPVVVKKSKIGLGLFASQPFKRGQPIVQYTGDIISNKEADQRAGKYLMYVDETQCIDGRARSNIARYINHACRPNCVYYIEDNNEVWAYAKRRIEPGEELTVDYGKEYVDMYIAPYGCKCQDCDT